MNDTIYCYIGGGRLLEPDCKPVLDELITQAGARHLRAGLVLLTSPRKRDTWYKVGKEFFNKIGVDDVFYFDPFNDDKENIFDFSKVKNVNSIFITGGSPDLFLEKIKELRIFDDIKELLLQENIFITGISAGALLLNKVCYISKDEEYPNELFLEGFNLRDDFICEVHYDENRFETLHNVLEKGSVWAVEENSALFCTPKGFLSVGRTHYYNRSK